jgi:hypothetical protein
VAAAGRPKVPFSGEEYDMSHHWWHLLHSAHHGEHDSPKLAAVLYIIVGFFFAPMLIGIPILLYGLYKLFK